jgi:lipopolysaccharide exporter
MAWNVLGTFLRVIIQFPVGIALARILGPDQVGLATVALLVYGAALILSDLGLTALVTTMADNNARGDEPRVAAIHVALGCLAAVAIQFGAGSLAELLGEPQSANLIRLAALCIPLQCVGNVPAAIMRRRMSHRALQVRQIAGYVLGYALVGIVFAILTGSAITLVIAIIGQAAVTSLLLVYAVGGIELKFDQRTIRLAGRGLPIFGTNIVNWLIENGDNLIISRVLGVQALGLYGRVYQLLRMPVDSFATATQQVLLPFYARRSHRGVQVGDKYILTAQLAWKVIPLPFVVVATVPGAFVLFLYGDEWRGAIPLITPLALAMPVHALMALGGPALWGTAKAKIELAAQIAALPILLGLVYVGARQSLEAAAWGLLTSYIFRAVFVMFAASRALGVSLRQWIQVLAWPTIGYIVVAGSSYFASQFMDDHTETSLLVVSVAAIAGVAAWTITIGLPSVIVFKRERMAAVAGTPSTLES